MLTGRNLLQQCEGRWRIKDFSVINHLIVGLFAFVLVCVCVRVRVCVCVCVLCVCVSVLEVMRKMLNEVFYWVYVNSRVDCAQQFVYIFC